MPAVLVAPDVAFIALFPACRCGAVRRPMATAMATAMAVTATAGYGSAAMAASISIGIGTGDYYGWNARLLIIPAPAITSTIATGAAYRWNGYQQRYWIDRQNLLAAADHRRGSAQRTERDFPTLSPARLAGGA